MTIAELLKELGENKKASAEVYKTYKAMKDDEELLKAELMDKLHEVSLKSAKGSAFTASIVPRVSIIVKHEQSVLEWLKEAPDIEADAYIGLKTTAFKQFAEGLLKKTGELIDGTDVVTNESISIKANKEK